MNKALKAALQTKALLAIALVTAGSAQAGEVWLQGANFSHHFDRSKNYNETNLGVGVQYRLNKRHAFSVGQYDNSNSDTSRYALYAYSPISLGKYVTVGGTFGVVDGYKYNTGAWGPFVAPTVTVTYKRVAMNVVVIPTVREKADGAVGVSLQWRIK